MTDAAQISSPAKAILSKVNRDDLLLEALTDIAVRLSSDGTLLWINSAFENTLGWSVSDWVGRKFAELVHPEDVDFAFKKFSENLAGHPTFSELRMKSKQGYLRLEVTGLPQIEDGSSLGVVALARDVTRCHEEEEQTNARLEELVRERTRALALANEALRNEIAHRQQIEERLRRRENELKTRQNNLALITHSLPALISYLDSHQRLQYVNAEYERWFANPQAWFKGRTLAEVFGDRAYEKVQPFMAKAYVGEVVSFDTWITYRQGERHITANCVPDFGITQEVRGIFVLIQDTTERRHFEEALQQSESRLRYIMENMPVMLDAFDVHGNILLWNAECERVTGYKASEIVNNPKAMEMLYPNSAYRKAMMDRWNETGHDYRDWEWEVRCKDGSIKTVAWSNVSKRFPIPGWYGWGVGVDVTDRRRRKMDDGR